LKGFFSHKVMFCASFVLLMSYAAAGCSATAGTTAPVTPVPVPTHQCSNWNYSSSAYEARSPYGTGYIVENDVWNPVQIAQKLYTCNFDSFYVEANVHNRDGAVQSYPSSQYTFASPPKISKFKSLTSNFRVSNPPDGSGLDYEFAYDIWFNGYGGNGHTEMMIWTYNDGRRPAGVELPGTITIEGRMFEVWIAGGDGYLVTFESLNNYTAANTNLLPFFTYVSSHGWLHDGMSTPLWQIDYGVELCATPTVTKFDFTNFSVRFKTS
jgi:Glycosyl hydrolase family 12